MRNAKSPLRSGDSFSASHQINKQDAALMKRKIKEGKAIFQSASALSHGASRVTLWAWRPLPGFLPSPVGTVSGTKSRCQYLTHRFPDIIINFSMGLPKMLFYRRKIWQWVNLAGSRIKQVPVTDSMALLSPSRHPSAYLSLWLETFSSSSASWQPSLWILVLVKYKLFHFCDKTTC